MSAWSLTEKAKLERKAVSAAGGTVLAVSDRASVRVKSITDNILVWYEQVFIDRPKVPDRAKDAREPRIFPSEVSGKHEFEGVPVPHAFSLHDNSSYYTGSLCHLSLGT